MENKESKFAGVRKLPIRPIILSSDVDSLGHLIKEIKKPVEKPKVVEQPKKVEAPKPVEQPKKVEVPKSKKVEEIKKEEVKVEKPKRKSLKTFDFAPKKPPTAVKKTEPIPIPKKVALNRQIPIYASGIRKEDLIGRTLPVYNSDLEVKR